MKLPFRISRDKALLAQLEEFQKNPRSLVFATLAERYRQHGLVDQALEICEEGLEFHPYFPAGLVVRAHCYFDQKRFADCLRELKQVIAQNRENIKALRLQADVYIRLGQKKAAIDSVGQILSFYPNDPEAKAAMAELLSTAVEGEEEQARSTTKAEAHKVERPQDLSGFEVKTIEKVALDELKTDGNAAQEIGVPAFATKTIAELYIRQGLKEKAQRVLEMMLEEDSRNQWAVDNLAKLQAAKSEQVEKSLSPTDRKELMLKARVLENMLESLHSMKVNLSTQKSWDDFSVKDTNI